MKSIYYSINTPCTRSNKYIPVGLYKQVKGEKMARRRITKKMSDDQFDPAKAVGQAAEAVARIPGGVVDFLAKRAYVTGVELDDVMSGNYYNRRSKGLNKLEASGASLETMQRWAEKKYSKRNKGGR